MSGVEEYGAMEPERWLVRWCYCCAAIECYHSCRQPAMLRSELPKGPGALFHPTPQLRAQVGVLALLLGQVRFTVPHCQPCSTGRCWY